MDVGGAIKGAEEPQQANVVAMLSHEPNRQRAVWGTPCVRRPRAKTLKVYLYKQASLPQNSLLYV